MFHNCSSLSDIKELENLNVSNGKDISYMFSGCKLLLDIKELENWLNNNSFFDVKGSLFHRILH